MEQRFDLLVKKIRSKQNYRINQKMMFLSMTEPFKIDWTGSLFISPVWGSSGEPWLNYSTMTEQEACSYLQYEILSWTKTELFINDWTGSIFIPPVWGSSGEPRLNCSEMTEQEACSCLQYEVLLVKARLNCSEVTKQEACSNLQYKVLLVNHDRTIQHWLNRKLVELHTSSMRWGSSGEPWLNH